MDRARLGTAFHSTGNYRYQFRSKAAQAQLDFPMQDDPAVPPFIQEMIDSYSSDRGAAIVAFQQAVFGPEWRSRLPQMLPQALEQVEANADLFFQHELPAVFAFRFTADDAARIVAPVLMVLSEERAPIFGYIPRFYEWLPETQERIIEDANHDLPIRQPRAIAEAILHFIADVESG